MSIKVHIEKKSNYLHVFCVGAFSAAAMMDVWKTAFNSAVDNNCKAILVDIRAIGGKPPTVVDRVDEGVYIARLRKVCRNDVLIAVVGDEPIVDHERLTEAVARNHGALISVFEDIAESVDWIETEIANAHELEQRLLRRSVLKNQSGSQYLH